MQIRPLAIEGAFVITPRQHRDDRGAFLEWYRFDHFSQAVGRPMRMAQGNISVSARGVIRGIHVTDVPPGQSKYVTCVRGALLDVIVDLRLGSPTFGRYETVRLDDVERQVTYLAEGLGHAFCALTDDAVAVYFASETYDPGHDRAIHPLDPELAIKWPVDELVLSPRDQASPTLAQARDQGWLPDYETCQKLYTAS